MSRDATGGLRLTAGALAAEALLIAAVFATPDPGELEIRVTLRLTALISAAWFLLAFTASAWRGVRPTPATAWLVRNRRYLGLAMAGSHLMHGAAIAALAARTPGGLGDFDTATRIVGSLGYVFIGLMALTSNDASQRALGPWWRRLHATGMYLLWFIFAVTYSGPATRSPFHALVTLALVAALGLRLFAPRRRAVTPPAAVATGSR